MSDVYNLASPDPHPGLRLKHVRGIYLGLEMDCVYCRLESVSLIRDIGQFISMKKSLEVLFEILHSSWILLSE